MRKYPHTMTHSCYTNCAHPNENEHAPVATEPICRTISTYCCAAEAEAAEKASFLLPPKPALDETEYTASQDGFPRASSLPLPPENPEGGGDGSESSLSSTTAVCPIFLFFFWIVSTIRESRREFQRHNFHRSAATPVSPVRAGESG